MIVELVGPPGVGKTTVANQLATRYPAYVKYPQQRLREAGTHRRRLAKVAAIARYATKYPEFTWTVTKRLVAAQNAVPCSEAARVAANWLVHAEVTKRADTAPAVTLLDQGLVQAYGSVLLGSSDRCPHLEQQLRRHTEAIPYRLVVLDASDAVLEDRLATRPGTQSRIERDTPWSIADARAAVSTAVESVTTGCDETATPVIEVSTDPPATPAAVARRIANWPPALTDPHIDRSR